MGVLDKIKAFFSGKSSPKGQLQGEIVHYNFKKGYGFIQLPGEEDRIFFHVTSLTGKARKGARVQFRTVQTDRGLQAEDIAVIQ